MILINTCIFIIVEDEIPEKKPNGTVRNQNTDLSADIKKEISEEAYEERPTETQIPDHKKVPVAAESSKQDTVIQDGRVELPTEVKQELIEVDNESKSIDITLDVGDFTDIEQKTPSPVRVKAVICESLEEPGKSEEYLTFRKYKYNPPFQ